LSSDLWGIWIKSRQLSTRVISTSCLTLQIRVHDLSGKPTTTLTTLSLWLYPFFTCLQNLGIAYRSREGIIKFPSYLSEQFLYSISDSLCGMLAEGNIKAPVSCKILITDQVPLFIFNPTLNYEIFIDTIEIVNF
jgi:hypothetical protein